MAKIKHLTSTILIAVLSGIVVIALISTIIWAAFSFTRQTSTTLSFADGVVVNVQGINEDNVWLASDDNFSTYIINDATIDAPTYDSIDIKVTSGPATNVKVYVRVFAIVYTDHTSLGTMTVASGNTTTTDYTTQERALINAVPSGCTYQVKCAIREYSAVATSFSTVINQYSPFSTTLTSAHLGKKTQGIVVITAKNKGSTDPAITTAMWNTVIADNAYPTWK